MKWVVAYIWVYLCGMIVFCTNAEFSLAGTGNWDVAYYIWQTLCYGSCMGWAALYAIGDNYVKKIVRWCLVLSLCKLAWEVISIGTRLDINNEKSEFVFLLIGSAAAAVLSLTEQIKAPRKIKGNLTMKNKQKPL